MSNSKKVFFDYMHLQVYKIDKRHSFLFVAFTRKTLNFNLIYFKN